MEKINLSISGMWVSKVYSYDDPRGSLIRVINDATDFNVAELYASITLSGYLRGMHFQLPPYPQNKIICCTSGLASDVVIDLRLNSPTYGETENIYLDGNDPYIVYIPAGCAHGYYAYKNSMILYAMDEGFHSECYGGIHWKSCLTPWPTNAIASDKDDKLPNIYDFETPFA